ncbi:hypothetical protein [Inediibacterium massiliense]|uniref:hypothetical protein n=1 Tax=Inediibacterium massiliense TaxID=1658111 RepID=UPI0018FECBA5|nr:hypothetical protein [Inediibacterium massiliense]
MRLQNIDKSPAKLSKVKITNILNEYGNTEVEATGDKDKRPKTDPEYVDRKNVKNFMS